VRLSEATEEVAAPAGFVGPAGRAFVQGAGFPPPNTGRGTALLLPARERDSASQSTACSNPAMISSTIAAKLGPTK
jgi:hypothetical protein